MMIDVVAVMPRQDFTLELVYSNGERRRFNAKPLLAVKPWTALESWTLFRRASSIWNCDLARESRYCPRNAL